MNQAEYERLLARLDSCIDSAERAKKMEEDRKTVEDALAKIREQMTGISGRIEDLKGRNIGVPKEAEEAFFQLVREEAILFDKLKKVSAPEIPSVPPEPKPISASIKAAFVEKKIIKDLPLNKKAIFLDLGAEIEKTNLQEYDHPMRWLLIELWACQWRSNLESLGQEYGEDKDVRRVYALIKESMEQHYSKDENCRYITALNPRKTDDWPHRLKVVQREFGHLRVANEGKKELRKKLAQLETLLKRDDLPYDEAERLLKHLVRDIARAENMRGELADIVEPYRASLGTEFDYLFENGKESSTPQEKARLSNRDVVSRLLRRMIRKNIIGGRYAPVDMIPKGFPPHDCGKAKSAIHVLSQTGVLSVSKNGEGISIDPRWVPQIERFLDGDHLGIPELTPG